MYVYSTINHTHKLLVSVSLANSFASKIEQHYQATTEEHGGVVVKALRYKPAGRGFDSRWSLEFFIDIILPAALWGRA